jgi:hypothetical protein
MVQNINTVIAKQCPLIGGAAVYNARAIITSYYPSLFYESDSLCQLAGFRIQNDEVADIKVNRTANVKIFPNPADHNVYVKNAVGYNYSLYDLQGKLLRYGLIHSNTESINLNEIENGIYIIKLFNQGAEPINLKLIIAR